MRLRRPVRCRRLRARRGTEGGRSARSVWCTRGRERFHERVRADDDAQDTGRPLLGEDRTAIRNTDATALKASGSSRGRIQVNVPRETKRPLTGRVPRVSQVSRIQRALEAAPAIATIDASAPVDAPAVTSALLTFDDFSVGLAFRAAFGIPELGHERRVLYRRVITAMTNAPPATMTAPTAMTNPSRNWLLVMRHLRDRSRDRGGGSWLGVRCW